MLHIQVVQCTISVIIFWDAERYISPMILDNFNLLIPWIEYKIAFFCFGHRQDSSYKNN